jgi:glycosyltransferase involved in cell wall biosynthesis
VWWFEWSIANWLNKHKPDLFLSPDGHGVLCSDVPQLLVMHDLAYEHFPKHMSWLQNQYFKYFMPRFAQHAEQLATVSEYSKADICKFYNIAPQKVDVVYSGVKDFFAPISENEKENIRAKFASGKPYFVYVGSVNPRKNVANILRAFDLFKTQSGTDNKLVIAGAKGWKTSEIFDVWNHMKFKTEVVFTGRLEETELVQVLAAAQVSLYPSLFEGFGVPPLEAMACGVPVITSNVSSLPEISGNAAIYVSPENVQDIAAKMSALAANEHLRNSLIEKGFEHYKQHSWDRTAKLLWESCLKVKGLI